MILAIDFRTDIPAFYSEWILNRFKEGFLYFRNPAYPTTLHKVVLDEEHIEGIIWCSKNYAPIMDRLHEITDRFPSVFHCTLTGYNADIEPNVPFLTKSLETIQELSKRYGKDHVVWRYDPIFYTEDWMDLRMHKSFFECYCDNLQGYVERCVINFISLYQKVKKHMPEVKELTYDQKIEIIQEFLKISQKYGIKLQTCGNGLQFKDLEGVEVTGCLDEHALNTMGIYPKSLNKETQWGCKCYPNTSVGEYNTCLHKCKYCYASADFDKCDENFKKHDPNSPLLIGWPRGDEKIIEMKPKKLNLGTKQLELF